MAIRKPKPSMPPGPSGAPPLKWRVALGSDGALMIPSAARAKMNMDSPGEVELELTMAGLVVRPVHPGRDPEQWWYWTEAWQHGEREIDRDRAAGKTGTIYLSDEDFIASLSDRTSAVSHPTLV